MWVSYEDGGFHIKNGDLLLGWGISNYVGVFVLRSGFPMKMGDSY